MKYWCDICKKEITEGIFKYSMDKFGRPLCLYHQKIERQEIFLDNSKKMTDTPSIIDKDTFKEINTKSNQKINIKKQKSFFSKVRNWVQNKWSNFEKKSQIQKWKSQILHRMSQYQIKKICLENNISTKKTVIKMNNNENDDALFNYKKEKCTRDELITRIRKKLSLDRIISYAKRGRVDIQDIRNEIDKTFSEWEVKELKKLNKQNNNNEMLTEIEYTIHKFKPFRRYKYEYPYQDSLAAFLKSQYPNTKIEESRSSTRPDIFVEGIAIEVKGPTSVRDLQTIADKCLRYTQYFPQGLICVLFDVQVSKKFYNDWLKGMKINFPNVRIVRIDL